MSTFIIERQDLELRFEWSGGAYIEIFNEGSATPFDVINVYDYELGQPRISMQGFWDEVERWVSER